MNILFRLLAVSVLSLSVFSTAYADLSNGGSATNQPSTVSNGGSSVNTPTQPKGPSVGLLNPLSAGTNLQTLLNDILALAIRIGTIVIVLMLVYIGFLFTTTSLNPENKAKAREYLLYTVIGALILLGAQAIALGIQETVNALSTGS